MKKTILASALITLVASGASAAVVTYGPTPTEIFKNPTAASISVGCLEFNCRVFENITNTNGGVNPWGNNNAGSYYSSVGKNSSATYVFDKASRALSFLWGTPDGGNNDLTISLSGVAGTIALTAQSLGIAGGSSKYVTISDIGVFDTVTFSSDQRAFEYGNLSATPVPVPAGAVLLLTGLAGLAAARRRKG